VPTQRRQSATHCRAHATGSRCRQSAHETTRAAVVEAGVPLGKGPLFGPPVMVDTGSVAMPGHAAA